MNIIYIIKENGTFNRKALVDMPFLAEHKIIRVQKTMFEEGSYIPYFPDKKNQSKTEKFYLTKENLKKEDEIFFYFKFPFKKEQFENADRAK